MKVRGTFRRRIVAGLVAAICFYFAPTAPRPALAGEALVAVAANFAEVAQVLASAFEVETGHGLALTTGSTGKLYAQIVAGAPFHALLSADAATPARLEAEGLAVAGAGFTYATGRLALWSADPDRIGADGAAALRDPALRHVAIANPALAPYGAAAREAMQALGIWDALRDRIVMGQNIGQTHAMVASGAAELGFVALSAVLSPRAQTPGSRWEPPQSLYAPILQDAALLLPGADSVAARDFLEFLRRPAALDTIRAFGYGVED